MSIHFVVSKEDLKNHLVFRQLQNRTLRLLFTAAITFLLGSYAGRMILGLQGTYNFSHWLSITSWPQRIFGALLLLLAVVAIALVAYYLWQWFLRLLYSIAIRGGSYRYVIGKGSVHLRDEYIESVNDDNTARRFSYGTLQGIYLYKNSYHLLWSRGEGDILIPKNAFSSANEENAFFTSLTERTGLIVTPA